jgi:hypothetical protein
VFSGIARPEIRTTNDDEIAWDEVVVRLGATVDKVLDASVFVGLASIGNGESGFAFALDEVRVEIDSTSRELTLVARTAVLGDPSTLSRFGYQVVVLATTLSPTISGEVRWGRGLYDIPLGDQRAVDESLTVVVNAVVMEPQEPPFAPMERLVPIASPASLAPATLDGEVFVVRYEATQLPESVPLKVTVGPLPRFVPSSGQLRLNPLSSDVITLGGPTVSVTGINFFIDSFILH